MKVKLTFIDKGFLSMGEVNLSRKDPEAEVDLTGKSDTFIATVVNARLFGKVLLNQSDVDLINLIKDPEMKRTMARRASLPVEDTNEVQIVTNPNSASVTVKPAGTIVDTAPEPDVIMNILDGSARQVVEALSKMKVNKTEIDALLAAEAKGKDRQVVKAAIASLAG